jgi:hypothetical protein
VECLGFDLLAFELATGVVEVEHHPALLQLLYEQIVPLFRADLCSISDEPGYTDSPMKFGSFSMSTFSVT